MRLLGLRVLVLMLCVPVVAAAQPSRDDGIRAFAAGDYSKAAEILRPFAENSQAPDHVARLVLAMLSYSGRGIAPNRIAACALFASVAACARVRSPAP